LFDRRHGLAIDGAVGQHALVDAVVIPFVMRSHLIGPGRDARIGIAGEDGGRPFVVARPLRGIPSSRIATAVENQIELRIVGVPAPGCAASQLPLVAAPSLEAGTFSHRLLCGAVDSLLRIGEDVRVRADVICAPHLLAAVDVVRGDIAADAIFSARNSDNHFVVNDERRVGHGLAELRIAVGCGPEHFAGLGVERVQLGIQRAGENLSVVIGDAAVDHVAASHRWREFILFRRKLPDDLADVVEVDCIHIVRVGALEVHHVPHHQRLPLLPAQSAGGHGPGHSHLAGIGLIDLLQRAVADRAVAPQGDRPIAHLRGAGGCSASRKDDYQTI